MIIGDYLDLEKEKSYPCSDGGFVHTVDVDALVEAAKAELIKVGWKSPEEWQTEYLILERKAHSTGKEEGYELGFHKAMAGSAEQEMKLAGRREVIEWINNHSTKEICEYQGYDVLQRFHEKEWQAKVKEWGQALQHLEGGER